MQSDTPILMLFLLLPLLIGLPMIYLAVQHRKKRIQSWIALAERLGLSYAEEGYDQPAIRGTLGGRPVSARCEQRGSGKSRHYVTVLRVELDPSAPLGLQLSPEGLFAKATKLIGAQDVQVGDPTFDKTFLIKANDEAEALRYFEPAHRRQALLDLHHQVKGWWIADYALIAEPHGILMGDQIEAQLHILIDAVNQHIGPDARGGW